MTGLFLSTELRAPPLFVISTNVEKSRSVSDGQKGSLSAGDCVEGIVFDIKITNIINIQIYCQIFCPNAPHTVDSRRKWV